MPRPRKVPANNVDRSVLFHPEQIRALEAAAAGVGAEVSDLIRAAVDTLFPAPDPNAGYAARARIRAALELRRREIDHRPALVEAVLAAWAVGDPDRVAGAAGRVASATARAVVAMLMAFFPTESRSNRKHPDVRWRDLDEDWAGTASDPVLHVISSPAVWAASVPEDKLADIRPWYLFVALPLVAWGAQTGAEDQYPQAATAFAYLSEKKVLRKLDAERPSPLGYPFPVDGYWLDWQHPGTRRGTA